MLEGVKILSNFLYLISSSLLNFVQKVLQL